MEDHEVPTGYVEEKYMHGQHFVHVNYKKGDLPATLLAFLGKYCPRLEAICTFSHVKFVDLLSVSASLKFLSCAKLLLPSTFDPESLFEPFKALERLSEALSDGTNSILLAKQLLRQNRPICTIELTHDNVDKSTFESFAHGVVKSIQFTMPSALNLLSNPTLQSLVNGCCGLSFCPIPDQQVWRNDFPELRYLNLISFGEEASSPQTHLLNAGATPSLRTFIFSGCLSLQFLYKMFKYIHSLEQLEALNVEVFNVDYEAGLEVEGDIILDISCPKNLKMLKLRMVPCGVINVSSKTLRNFVIDQCPTVFEFDFPVLKTLSIKGVELGSLPPELIQSLSKCSKMRNLDLSMKLTSPAVDRVQALVDAVSKLNSLRKLQIRMGDFHEPTVQMDTRKQSSEVIRYKKRDFLSLQHFCFDLPFNVTIDEER